MKENFNLLKDKVTSFWNGRTQKQKNILLSLTIVFIIVILASSYFGLKTNFAPLYSNLSVQETGKIKATLDARGITSEISDNGTTIKVPQNLVDTLKVELAAEGIPNSGSIDYSIFQENMGFGMTDNEFSVVERAAMQTELSNLIRNIEGVNRAEVMITLPEESVWVSQEGQAATASIVVDLVPGYNLEQPQIKALYHLVSKSVPNLPTENIVIMNQMFEHLELQENQNIDTSTLTTYEQQRRIKKEVEQDIQRQLQQMLGTMMGRDKVVVSVSTDIDFTQEVREENLVQPVDEEKMEGLAISVERITETFEGYKPEDAEEVVEAPDIPNYPYGNGFGGDFDRAEERINRDVNRIRKDIVESPYQIRDLGIQVMVEPPNPEEPESLPPERLQDIQQILGTIVRTSISDRYLEGLTPEQINEKIFVSAQPFNGKIEMTQGGTQPILPLWIYVVGGISLVIILLLFVLLVRKGKSKKEEPTIYNEYSDSKEVVDDYESLEIKQDPKVRQIEDMIEKSPEDFTKLVKSWMAEDSE